MSKQAILFKTEYHLKKLKLILHLYINEICKNGVILALNSQLSLKRDKNLIQNSYDENYECKRRMNWIFELEGPFMYLFSYR